MARLLSIVRFTIRSFSATLARCSLTLMSVSRSPSATWVVNPSRVTAVNFDNARRSSVICSTMSGPPILLFVFGTFRENDAENGEPRIGPVQEKGARTRTQATWDL